MDRLERKWRTDISVVEVCLQNVCSYIAASTPTKGRNKNLDAAQRIRLLPDEGKKTNVDKLPSVAMVTGMMGRSRG